MALAPQIDLRPYFQILADIEGPFDWQEYFGNDHPVEVEVGAGRGLFLFNEGRRRPESNFLGIEINYREGRRAALRVAKREMSNVRFLGGDAKVVLGERIASASVAGVHVYFPDPWWKRRHKPRRVFDDFLVEHIRRILIPRGKLHFWTDVEEYFDVAVKMVDEHAAFGPRTTPPERSPENDMDYHTSFERKKRKLGLPIFRAEWCKLEE
ncbi:tRNA (guanine-N(7)-)-methyltransferase [Symmachiella dynata]|uniref:tRNA (guanosine(46)-N7)-methyltransferase TrmB n=1 Tax=Symmachiella dynata TaxID=2527995 RepID=UPI00118BD955|nr:tRNA (guanosine(46)-N7)-methyltransferase TrmB [Symmachiella dynata]QDT49248.1 tRNA (guanine-N(7)-)-methyltransferase [Symmachiella dynata]